MDKKEKSEKYLNSQFQPQGENLSGKDSVSISVRFSKKDLAEITSISDHLDITRAKFIREATLKAIGK